MGAEGGSIEPLRMSSEEVRCVGTVTIPEMMERAMTKLLVEPAAWAEQQFGNCGKTFVRAQGDMWRRDDSGLQGS